MSGTRTEQRNHALTAALLGGAVGAAAGAGAMWSARDRPEERSGGGQADQRRAQDRSHRLRARPRRGRMR